MDWLFGGITDWIKQLFIDATGKWIIPKKMKGLDSDDFTFSSVSQKRAADATRL